MLRLVTISSSLKMNLDIYGPPEEYNFYHHMNDNRNINSHRG
jgi:hypothetical protein